MMSYTWNFYKSKIRAPTSRFVSGENPPPGSPIAVFSLCPVVVEGTGSSLGSLFVRALIPLMKAPSSWLNHLPKTPTPNIITLEIRFQDMNFGRTQICSPWQMGIWRQHRRNLTGLGSGQEAEWRPKAELSPVGGGDVCYSGLKQVNLLITERCWPQSRFLHQEKSSTFTNYFHLEFQIQLRKNLPFQGPISWPSWCN